MFGTEFLKLSETMGNITRPEYFTHIEKHIPGMSLKVFHPPGIPFDQAPPNFHVKAWLFLHRDGKGSLITGSSNFTESGLTKNFEWNYFSSHEINLPFGNTTSPFESAVAEFERIWANESVDVSEAFLEGYRQRWEPTSGWKVPEFQDTGIFETAPGCGDRA